MDKDNIAQVIDTNTDLELNKKLEQGVNKTINVELMSEADKADQSDESPAVDREISKTDSEKTLVTNAAETPIKLSTNATNEMNAMSNLNARLRDYLHKVKSVNHLNCILSHKLVESYGDLHHQLTEKTENFRKELSDLREKYIKIYLEYIFYDIKYGRWEQKNKQMRVKIKSLEEELSSIMEQRKEIEPKKKRLDEEIAQINSRIRETTEENRKAKTGIEKLEQEEEQLAEKLETDKIIRAHLELQVEFAKAEIIFSRMLHDEVVGIYKKLGADNVSDARFYEMELERAAREIRAEFSRRSEQSMRELATDYENKLQQLQISFQRMDDPSSVDSSQQKNKQNDIRESLANAQDEVQKLRSKNMELSNQLSGLENALEQVLLENRESIHRREDLIQSTRARIMELLIKCQSAKSAKCSLESEIDTYRHILGDEEVRMQKLNENLPPELSTTSHAPSQELGMTSGVITRSRALLTQSVSSKVTSETLTTKREDIVLSSRKIDAEYAKKNSATSDSTKKSSPASEVSPSEFRTPDSSVHLVPKVVKEDTELLLKCRCGKSGNVKINSGNEIKYVQCIDCGNWSHAGCYNVGDAKDRKRRNFYCSACYQAIKKHRS